MAKGCTERQNCYFRIVCFSDLCFYVDIKYHFWLQKSLPTHCSWSGDWHLSCVHHPLDMGCLHGNRCLKLSLIEAVSNGRHTVCTHCRYLGQAPGNTKSNTFSQTNRAKLSFISMTAEYLKIPFLKVFGKYNCVY